MISNSKSNLVSVVCVCAALILSGCQEGEDADKIASAQACLDRVSDATPSDANACMMPIASLTSQRAYVLKCAITFTAGGLTTTKIANAYKALKNNATNKEMIYMGTLALSPASLATTAANYCNLSGSPGLIYLAQLSVIGSAMMTVVGTYDPNSGTAPSLSDAQAAISACSNGGSGGVCDDTVVGNAVITIGQTYCAGDNANVGVCTKMTSAIAASAGDPTSVALQLYTQLN